MYKLVISEKPSVAASLSAVLGAKKREDGYFIGGGYIVSYCFGHLLELAAPDAYGEYAKWRYADLPIIPDKWKHVASKDKAAQLKILKDLMNRSDVDCVINACDAGREGENIFRLVYEHAKCKKKIMRLWISSLEDTAIKAGFNSLKDGKEYDNLYAAASCRERADWIVGYNVTRLFSVIYQSTLNCGRVQSPTLAMLVKREADISAFIKEVFYMPEIICNGNYGMCGAFSALGERQKDLAATEAIRATCDGKTAVVRSVERQKKTVAPPKLYDLTTLQREANRLYGFTAAQTLEYAQSLYEKAIISYPRVDSRYLTADMRGTAGALVEWMQKEMGSGFTPDIDRFINDDKVSDHHAIIPTANISKADISALPSGERELLNLITVRLLCAAAPVHSYEAVTAVIDCGGYSFTSKGKTIIDEGWKAIDAAFKASLKAKPEAEDSEDDNSLPELTERQIIENVTTAVKEGATTPPKHFTEDTLLSAMENAGMDDINEQAERRGLGTPATRASIIEKIVKTGFVERQKKNLIPSDKGVNLIAVLPDALKSPVLTADWENRLFEVQREELAADDFMSGIAEFIKEIVKQNNAPKPEYAGLFGGNKTENESLGVCPRCGAAVRESKKGFFCDTDSCGFKIWKESKFWTAKKKPLTAAIVAALLKDGRVDLKNLHSGKTGKKYDATVILDDTSDGYVNFKLDFGKRM
jgi:DNA topoisomerase-3